MFFWVSAYQVLTNEDKRRIYDRYGEAGLKDEGRGNFQNSNDIFERYFLFLILFVFITIPDLQVLWWWWGTTTC